MQAGRLDQRVSIERFDYVRDSNGEVIQDPDTGEVSQEWVTQATCWAAVEPLQGREFIAAMATQSETTARIRMRYRPGIDSTMRVKHGADTYGIEAVIHVKSARRELQLMCKAMT